VRCDPISLLFELMREVTAMARRGYSMKPPADPGVERQLKHQKAARVERNRLTTTGRPGRLLAQPAGKAEV
jgi:hypothetical protein